MLVSTLEAEGCSFDLRIRPDYASQKFEKRCADLFGY